MPDLVHAPQRVHTWAHRGQSCCGLVGNARCRPGRWDSPPTEEDEGSQRKRPRFTSPLKARPATAADHERQKGTFCAGQYVPLLSARPALALGIRGLTIYLWATLPSAPRHRLEGEGRPHWPRHPQATNRDMDLVSRVCACRALGWQRPGRPGARSSLCQHHARRQ